MIQRVSPSASRVFTDSAGRVRAPTRSQPDRAKIPGCMALYMATSRWARWMSRRCASVRAADVANPEGGGGHGGGGAGDAIGGLQVVGRGRAEEAAVHLGSDDLAQLAPLHRLAAEGEGGVLVAGPEVHQLEGELVVVLERVDEACRIDLVGLLEPRA